jgi:hypothetical protein
LQQQCFRREICRAGKHSGQQQKDRSPHIPSV